MNLLQKKEALVVVNHVFKRDFSMKQLFVELNTLQIWKVTKCCRHGNMVRCFTADLTFPFGCKQTIQLHFSKVTTVFK